LPILPLGILILLQVLEFYESTGFIFLAKDNDITLATFDLPESITFKRNEIECLDILKIGGFIFPRCRFYLKDGSTIRLKVNDHKKLVELLNTNSGTQAGPQILGNGGGGAVWSMHRPSAFGLNMGLDSDNVFRIGGWSASANLLQMDMSGNLTMLNNVTAFSDERVKTNWRPVQDGFVEKLAQLKSGIYDRTDIEVVLKVFDRYVKTVPAGI
jgi:hypothetical protein